MITEFWDEDAGGFFFTSNDHEELVVRNKDFYDNATPSGNSVAADVLLRIAKLTGEEKYERFAVTTLRLAASQIRRHPQGFGRALSALEFHLGGGNEIAVIGDTGNDLATFLLQEFRPHDVLVIAQEGAGSMPLLEGRAAIDGQPTAYVCKDFMCKLPATTVDALRTQLG